MILATVSSWSCFCLLYRASPSLAAKNIINLIILMCWCYIGVDIYIGVDHLVMFMLDESISVNAAVTAKSLQSCPTLCDPTDGSPPGSSVHGILQARTLEWVAISFSNA